MPVEVTKPGLQSPEGEELELYTLTNSSGLELKILSFGATITSLVIPVGNSKRNIVLGYQDLKGYTEDNPAYLGNSVGRVAGRIKKGKFTLDNVTYQLVCNNGDAHLHGGKKGFSKLNWSLKSMGDSSVVLAVTSPDGDQGYPGEVKAEVSYALKNLSLSIIYSATSNKDTPINLVNHAYFNLSGDGDILDHILQLRADKRALLDDSSSPTGEIVSVSDTPYDFRKPCVIGARIAPLQSSLKKGYDDVLCLDCRGEMMICGSLRDPEGKLCMTVETDQPAVVLYTGNYLSKPHTGVCLETQNLPNAINIPSFPSCVLRPGQEYIAKTKWSFSYES